MAKYRYRIKVGGRTLKSGDVTGFHHAAAAKNVRKKITITIIDSDGYISSHKQG